MCIRDSYSTGSDCYHTADMGTAGFSRSVGRRFHHCGIRFLFCNGICKTGRTGGKPQQSGVWYDHCNSVVFHLVVKTDWQDVYKRQEKVEHGGVAGDNAAFDRIH